MMEQVRLCAVWLTNNWFGSSMNQIQGRMLLPCFRKRMHVLGLAASAASYVGRGGLKRTVTPKRERVSLSLSLSLSLMYAPILLRPQSRSVKSLLTFDI